MDVDLLEIFSLLVENFWVRLEDISNIDRKGAVDEDRDGRDCARVDHAMQAVDQLLGTSHGK